MSEERRKQFGVDENKPNDWFETLYATSNTNGNGIPWANMAPHPIFKNWLDNTSSPKSTKTALVIGCGLGDDAIALEEKGYVVTAFDVSDSAIELCKKRFPNSNVTFLKADLITGIPEWHKNFDFVLEIFTIQALPPKYESTLIENIADFVAKNGELILVTEVQNEDRNFENGPPWLLNTNYIEKFEKLGLQKRFQSIEQEAEMGDALHLTVFARETN